jgi:ketosteroid isomerase-like protein
MSQADIEDIRARYAAITAGDRAAAFRGVHPGFTLKTPDRVPNAGTYFGEQETVRFFDDFWEPFEEVITEPQEFVERGDRIVVILRVRLRSKGSSAFVELRVGAVWAMKDGKPLRLEMYPEAEEAFEAVGMEQQGRNDV